MDRNAVLDRIRARLEENLGVEPDEVLESTRLVTDLDIDSLDLIELIVAMKKDFGITVADGEIKALLGGLARFLPEEVDEAEVAENGIAALADSLTVATVIDFVLSRSDPTKAAA